MKNHIRARYRRAIAAAASLTGKRFGLLVASSLVATSAIVAAALTNPTGVSPLAALVGQTLAADQTPTATEPAPIASPRPQPARPGPRRGPRAGRAPRSANRFRLRLPSPRRKRAARPNRPPRKNRRRRRRRRPKRSPKRARSSTSS